MINKYSGQWPLLVGGRKGDGRGKGSFEDFGDVIVLK